MKVCNEYDPSTVSMAMITPQQILHQELMYQKMQAYYEGAAVQTGTKRSRDEEDDVYYPDAYPTCYKRSRIGIFWTGFFFSKCGFSSYCVNVYE